MKASTYKIRQIGKELKQGTGRYVVRGLISGGDRWPDQPHYWNIDDCEEQQQYHVLEDDRPTWAKYENN